MSAFALGEPWVTQLVSFEGDEYDVKATESKKEIEELLKVGFEWAGHDKDRLVFLRKRKMKKMSRLSEKGWRVGRNPSSVAISPATPLFSQRQPCLKSL
jgi:phage host-nuclease inhibitor protein Gam